MTPGALTVWLTGLSGSGKSTLARGLSRHLTATAVPHEVLDGDELRRTLCKDLGYSKADRDENVRRIAARASELNRTSVVAVVAAISPYRQARGEARQQARRECHKFVEVFVDCPLDILTQRDPKGLYRRALSGELQNFSGVSDPYEAPETPEIHLNTGLLTEQECLALLIAKLGV